jgi:hypothetical protein
VSVSSWEVLGALALLEMGLAEFIDLVSMWKSTHTHTPATCDAQSRIRALHAK